MKKILIIYYTQTGQLKRITNSLADVFSAGDNFIVDYYQIKPVNDFPFPWSSDEFFDTMPESVNKEPIELILDDFPIKSNYDLVILAYQVWYLSPSIPVSSFLQSRVAKDFFDGKKVITFLGVRNMWAVAHDYVKDVLADYNADLVGNIVLTDKAHNLVSVLTIIKWLMGGNKGPYKFLPEAGVSENEIKLASRFAKPVLEGIMKGDFSKTQKNLVSLGAVKPKYHLIQMEKNAYRIFKIWAKFIRKKGEAKNRKRLPFVRLFKYYLLFVIFVLSPVATVVFVIKRFLFYPKACKQLQVYKGLFQEPENSTE